MNAALPRVIIAPITNAGQPLGYRPELVFAKKPAKILLDQLRCLDKVRLMKKMGNIKLDVWHPVLVEMLA
jgi:mRNA interferase MazF